jgi:hypothetical protein
VTLPFWWQLPGPAEFIDGLVRDLRDGKNVVVCLPRYAPDGLDAAVRRALGDDRSWERWIVEQEDHGPVVEQLYRRFIPNDEDVGALRNAGTLARNARMLDHLVLLDGFEALADERRSDWLVFAGEYSHACRTLDPADRPLFIMILRGACALRPPISSPCLSVHTWDGVVDGLDMLLYAAELRRSRPLPSELQRVAVAVIAQLAAWDPYVAERLSAEGLERIVEPATILREIADERGWRNDGERDSDGSGWSAGTVATLEGRPVVHSAAVVGPVGGALGDEIERRIWRAEVGVLLPFVEERRRAIIEQFEGAFRLPHYRVDNRNEPVREAQDLEIGDIYHQVVHQHVDIGRENRMLVPGLKEMRDLLAHLQPLPRRLLIGNDLLEREDWR